MKWVISPWVSRIGVMVCHCGNNIAATVDCEGVAAAAREFPDVVFATDHMYACSDPGQKAIEQVIRDHDPEGVPLPFLAPYATDAKHLARIGVPTYGFSPLRMGTQDSFLQLLHGDDERVSIEALRFGLPVLWEAVIRFCG